MWMQQNMRWFGPQDTVSLKDIKQAGCSGVVTALHEIPVGEVWTIEAITARKKIIETAGLAWKVIESLPVSEDIKRRSGNFEQHLLNYKTSVQNVASCGLEVITYNFMPLLDWIRTDTAYELEDGAKALFFKRAAFVAFDLFLLNREGASEDYTQEEVERATVYFEGLTESDKQHLFKNVMMGLPGSKDAFTREQVLAILSEYDSIQPEELRHNLVAFLKEITPVAEAAGIMLAIHPDDPPYPVLGLPRIVSTEEDLAFILESVPLKANGLCFCTGSLGARADNKVLSMLKRFGERVHFLHLRNTKRDEQGNFYEAAHLQGDTDMYSVVKEIVLLQQRLNKGIPMRPDHGHQMLDDLQKETYPGYSAIGRLKGLAELRGLELGIKRSLSE